MSSTPTPTTTTTITNPPSQQPPPFDFPREYHFPPFFTRQTNLTTHHSQLEKWSSLVLSYARQHRLFRLSLSYDGTPYEDLFRNRKLGRSLRLSDARQVFEFMRKEGRAEPVATGTGTGNANANANANGGPAGDLYWVYWRTPEEWAALVEAWVDETAQKGAVLTLYELTDGEATRGTEFYGLDPDLLQKALQVLVKRGKAQIFGQEDQQGVKFF
ncbi:ESCRT-II complex, vps25 subunit [Daldinia decipiens]|uniref:ESCRT-II complex, vps25 subunit n=1 Tax=Daldinia decipiens TaxID=326647 RepID=UPI0020C52D27|nr:ESCRT-II complex, vps25 subunit [Daldinia decipiens]KAI1662094.1 ESCRT-II complex, vps25 subunit [Daldinia decipiens]